MRLLCPGLTPQQQQQQLLLQQQQQQFQQLQQAQQLQLQQQQQLQPPGAPLLPYTHGTPFSPDQIADLRYQIIAFKLISANMAVPPHLQEAIFSSKVVDQVLNAQEPTASVAGRITDIVHKHLSDKITPVAADFNAYSEPFSFLQKDISTTAHASRQQRLLIPSTTPVGLDPYALVMERDSYLRSRVQNRIEELDHHSLEPTPTETAELTGDNLEMDIVEAKPASSKLQIKALIELRSLKLLERQKKVFKGRKVLRLQCPAMKLC